MKYLALLFLIICRLPTEHLAAQETIPADSVHCSLYSESIEIPDASARTEGRLAGSISASRVMKAVVLLRGKIPYEKIDKLEITLGTAPGKNDLLSCEFTLDSNTGLPAGLSFFRDGNLIILNLGRDTGEVRKFARLRFKYMNGKYSEPIVF